MSMIQGSRYLLRACSSLVRGYQNRRICYRVQLLRVNRTQRRDIQRYTVKANQDNEKEDIRSSSSQSTEANADDSTPAKKIDQSKMENVSAALNLSLEEVTNVKKRIEDPTLRLLGKVYYILGSDCDMESDIRQTQLISCLKRLLMLTQNMEEKERDRLINQKFFYLMEGYVKANVDKVHFTTLEVLLKFFLKVQREDTELLEALLHEAVWRSRSTSCKETFVLLSVLGNNHNTPKRDELFKVCKARVAQSVDEIQDSKELITAMYLLQDSDSVEIKQKLDELAMKLMESMTPVQIYRVIYLMAKNRARNFVLLKRAAYHLCKRPLNFDEVKLKNLFYSCEVLNLHQNELLEDMSVNLLDKLANENGDTRLTVSLPVLTSLSKLGWSYKALTQSIMEDLQHAFSVDRSSMTTVQKAGLIVSLGSLDLCEYGKFALELFESIGDLKTSDSRLWLNVVYSMALLKRAPAASIQEILQPIFYISLLESIKDQPVYQRVAVMTKLLHLSGCIHLELGAGEGLLPQEVDKFLPSLHDMMKSNPPKALVEDVATVLTNLAPLEKYVNRNVIDRHGHKIDFEFYVNERGKAKRLEKYEGMKKIGIRVLDFQDMVRGDREPRPNGHAAMSIRHLTAGEHCVIQVSYHEWSKYRTKIDQTQYLEKLIEKAVSVETNPSATSAAGNTTGIPSSAAESPVE